MTRLLPHRILHTVILCCMLMLTAYTESLAQVPQTERQALIDLYNSTNGSNWLEEKAWDLDILRNGDLRQLPNLYLTDDKQHIAGIALVAANLTGMLPSDLFTRLPKLQIFSVDQNKIGGTIPTDLSGATELKALQLGGGNQFGGKIPDLSALKALEVLTLDFMIHLDEQPLPAFTQSKHLEIFDASGSNFTGHIPIEVGTLSALTFFDVSMNKLSGDLPAELNDCTRLNILSVMDNKLSGSIPDLGNLVHLGPASAGETGRLYLSQNQFTGSFPAWITRCTKLDRFSISDNKLSGSLPEDLSSMTSLQAFYVGGNQFTGSLPRLFAPSVEDLDFTHNQFAGNIPVEWRALPKLWKILVGFNRLSGYVPPIYLDAQEQMKEEFETIEAYQNLFSFADFKDWTRFAKSKDVKFRFSLQRPYGTPQRVDVAKGGQATLEATYPGALIGDESYQWFDLNLAKPIAGANQPTLTIPSADESAAHRYICFVTTSVFGKGYPSLFSSRVPHYQAGNIVDEYAARPRLVGVSLQELAPTLQSAFFDLYVDGKSAASTHQADKPSDEPAIYPSVISLGGSIHLSHASGVREVRFFSPDGRMAYIATGVEVRSGGGSISPQIPTGIYIVFVVTQDGSSRHSRLVVQGH